ncbi:MAG: PDZ domain-containing protein [Acidobacteriota bacterium]
MSAIDSIVVRMMSYGFSHRTFLRSLFFMALFASGVCFAESQYEESGLVQVQVTNELGEAGDALAINGHLLDDYNPTIIVKFSSPGVVLDADGHIMTFLGYGRIFIDKETSKFQISTSEGNNHGGKLVGIDHGNGAAVIEIPDEKLVRTAICAGCIISEGATVIAPVFKGSDQPQFQATQVISMQSRNMVEGSNEWVLRMNRPFLDVGQPFFTKDHRVLGFIVSQDPSGVQNVVYPVSELLSSANKIIEENGDIRTGWLGVNLQNILMPSGSGVMIRGVVQDSPAQKSGLTASDIVLQYNGEKIDNVLGFIHLVQDTPVGSSATLDILRRGRPMTLTANIAERQYQNPLKDMLLDLQDLYAPPRAQLAPGRPQEQRRPRIGFDTVALDPRLANLLQVSNKTGLLVVNIVRQSPADLAGLKNGDV